MFVDPGFLWFGRRTAGGAFLLAFGQGFIEDRGGLLERNASATAVDFLAGKALGGHFDIGGQQHHVGIANGLLGQGRTCAYRALGFHLQVVTLGLGGLLQRFGGHKSVGHAGGAGGDGDNARHVFYRRHCGAGNVQLGLLRAPLQHRFNVL